MIILPAVVFTGIGFTAGMALVGDFPFLESAFSSWLGSIITGLLSGFVVALLSSFVIWKHDAYSHFTANAYAHFNSINGNMLFASVMDDAIWGNFKERVHDAAIAGKQAGWDLQRIGFNEDGLALAEASVRVLKILKNDDRNALRPAVNDALQLTIDMRPPILFIATVLAWKHAISLLSRAPK